MGKELDKTLVKFTAYAIQRAKLELGTVRTIRGRKVRRVSSGSLQKSLFGRTFEATGKTTIGFGSTENYADFVHDGVNGTEINVGSSFSFRSANLAKGVMERYIKQKGVKLRDASGQFVERTEANIKRAAFAMGRSIAKNGIVPVPFMTLGIEAAIKKFDGQLLKAVEIDLDSELSEI